MQFNKTQQMIINRLRTVYQIAAICCSLFGILLLGLADWGVISSILGLFLCVAAFILLILAGRT